MSTFTRLHKETKLYKPDAIADGIEDASSTATDYVTEISSGAGIEVHPRNNAHDKVQITPSGMEVFQNDDSVAAYGSTSRIGKVGDVHVIVDQDSLDVMDGEDTLATFGEETRIGKEDESHLELDYHSMQLVSQQNNRRNTYFHVSDLRERNGTFSRTDTLDVDITVPISSFELAIPASEIISVKFGYSGDEEDVDPSGYSVHRSSTAPYDGYITSLTFSPPLSLIDGEPDPDALYPAVVVSLVVAYVSDIPARVLTFGSRTGNVGPYSSALGQYNVASGHTSHARGLSCVASGKYACADGEEAKAEGQASHAFGKDVRAVGYEAYAEGRSTVANSADSHAQNYGTVTSSYSQTAMGTFNVEDHYLYNNTVTDTFTVDGSTYVFVTSKVVAYTVSFQVNGVEQASHPPMDSDQRTFRYSYATIPPTGSTIRFTYYTTTHPSKAPGYGQYALIVGNGTDPSRRSNAFAVQWDGVTTHYGDIPWTDFPIASTVNHYSSTKKLRYRKWGQMVNLMGAVSPKADLPAGMEYSLTIGTLPVGCRPQGELIQLCQGSGTASWMLRITTGGVVTAERYRTGSGYAVMPAASSSSNGAWLTFNVTFLV